ncbi:MAG: hypothetical protein DME50_17355 [Verrucomicrobia bacterium]|nr:MAG: hypothetical protein DME50_17355 [Verrucomicrobiota bacterium]
MGQGGFPPLQRFNDVTIQRGEAIFSETLPAFLLCKGVMNTSERPDMTSRWEAKDGQNNERKLYI